MQLAQKCQIALYPGVTTFGLEGFLKQLQKFKGQSVPLSKILCPISCTTAWNWIELTELTPLPRDIVVKPLFYGMKEEVMHISRNTDQLSIQWHPIQVFTDLSLSTIQQRRSLKPLLQVLSQKSIKYWWFFPFRFSFVYRSKTHSFSLFQDGKRLLVQLSLISLDSSSTLSHKNTGSAKRPSPQSPITPVRCKQQSKMSKDSNPSWPPRFLVSCFLILQLFSWDLNTLRSLILHWWTDWSLGHPRLLPWSLLCRDGDLR